MTQAIRTDEQLEIHQQKAREYHSKIESEKDNIRSHQLHAEVGERRLVLLQQLSEANQKVIVGYTYLNARPDEERQRVLKFNIEALEVLKQQYDTITQETQNVA